jgi:N-acetylmuramic acid 6-phosphate (MurNAc-6-P) etherase
MEPITEQCNPLTTNIDIASTTDIVKILHDADRQMFSRNMGLLSDETLQNIQRIVDATVDLLQEDEVTTGSCAIVLSGCGTSGRLAFMTARSFNRVQQQFSLRQCFDYLVAGKDEALFVSRELAEDSPQIGRTDLESLTQGKSRVLYIGITCGLSAAYVAGQLDYCMAHLDKFLPVLIGFNPVICARNLAIEGWDKTFLQVAMRLQKYESEGIGFILNPIIGPEPITGSTRMKCGSATKILLDTMFSAALWRLLDKPQPPIKTIIEAFRSVDELAYSDVDQLATLVDLAAHSLRQSGHIYYVSTSDRLALCGLIDASECKPTYGADIEDVRGFLDGGFSALGNRQGELDHVLQISTDYFKRSIVPRLTPADIIVLIVKDGEVCTDDAVLDSNATKVVLRFTTLTDSTQADRPSDADRDVITTSVSAVRTFALPAGGEAVTSLGDVLVTSLLELACKLTCNVLTTGAYVKCGKVYENCMIDLRVSNNKLFHRAVNIIERFGQCSKAEATEALLRCIYDTDTLTGAQLDSTVSQRIVRAAERQQIVPLAILLARLRCLLADGRRILSESPVIRQAIATCCPQPVIKPQ